MVATPIGNLQDITLRSVQILRDAPLIGAEDTRTLRRLLAALNISASGKRLLSLRAHNESQAAETLLAAIPAGGYAVYTADAGTPCISDPGSRLVQIARKKGMRVVAVPGASALTTLIAAAGLSTSCAAGGVHFFGFVPRATQQRDEFFLTLRGQQGCVVVFESPHRIRATTAALAIALGEGCRVVLGRELTKRHEEVIETTLGPLAEAVAQGQVVARGEFALLIEPPGIESTILQAQRIFTQLRAFLPPRQAAAATAKIVPCDAKTLYSQHLRTDKQS